MLGGPKSGSRTRQKPRPKAMTTGSDTGSVEGMMPQFLSAPHTSTAGGGDDDDDDNGGTLSVARSEPTRGSGSPLHPDEPEGARTSEPEPAGGLSSLSPALSGSALEAVGSSKLTAEVAAMVTPATDLSESIDASPRNPMRGAFSEKDMLHLDDSDDAETLPTPGEGGDESAGEPIKRRLRESLLRDDSQEMGAMPQEGPLRDHYGFIVDDLEHFEARAANSPFFRVSACAARTLNATGSLPCHSIAVLRALKSSL